MKMKKLAAFLMAVCMVFSLVACGNKQADNAGEDGKGYTIAFLPTLKGESYFDSCRIGAEEACEKYGCTLLFDAPPADNSTNQKQVDLIEGWVAQGVDAIVVSPIDAPTLATTLDSVREEGVKVVVFGGSNGGGCDLFVSQASIQNVVDGLMEIAKKDLEAKGYGPNKPANISMISVPEVMEEIYLWECGILEAIEKEEYSFMKIMDPTADILRIDGSEASTNECAAALLSRMGEGEDQIQVCFGLTTMATAAMGAQYETLAVKPDPNTISLVGLSNPNGVKSYIKDSDHPMNYTALWNPIDMGYLCIEAAVQLLDGTITAESEGLEAGRLGHRDIIDQAIFLGPVSSYDIANIDDYDF